MIFSKRFANYISQAFFIVSSLIATKLFIGSVDSIEEKGNIFLVYSLSATFIVFSSFSYRTLILISKKKKFLFILLF